MKFNLEINKAELRMILGALVDQKYAYSSMSKDKKADEMRPLISKMYNLLAERRE